MFESPDDLNAESQFWLVTEIDTVMATTGIFVDEVNAKKSSKQLTQLTICTWFEGIIVLCLLEVGLKFLRP